MAIDFELVEHTADLQLHVYGSSLQQLFKHALVGMFQSIGPHATGCDTKNGRLICETLPVERKVAVEAMNRELLLVDFLSQALYLSDVHNEAYLDADMQKLTDTQVQATLKGVPITGFDVVEIKAVTYHDLVVEQRPDGSWYASIVFDI